MCDQQSSLQFRDKSISQLVQQLNNLGDTNIIMKGTTLIGILDHEVENIRRFRSKSVKGSRVGARGIGERGGAGGEGGSVGDSRVRGRGEGSRQLLEFFLTDGSNKKYYHDEIANELQIPTLGHILSSFEQGFHTNIVMQYRRNRVQEILHKIQPWLIQQDNMSSEQNARQVYASYLEFRSKDIVDLLAGKGGRVMALNQAVYRDRQAFYQLAVDEILALSASAVSYNHIKVLKLTRKPADPADPNPQLRLVLLPQQFLSMTPLSDPALKLTKSQLSQLLTYIKSNPNKKYENVHKLLPKRYPTTTVLAEMLMYDSVNFCVNWVADGSQGAADGLYGRAMGEAQASRELVNGRFEFFGKLAGISNLVKKAPTHKHTPINVIKSRKSVSKPKVKKSPEAPHFYSQENIPQNPQKPSTLERTSLKPASQLQQLQYCRSLQRKTHKYSIASFPEQASNVADQPLFPQTIPLYPRLPQQLSQPEAITILKAQHAREVSQYHQTIQNLNKKILVLAGERDLGQLVAIHEREIMMLELKIKELRADIAKLCGKEAKDKEKGGKQLQNMREIIKKLTEQLNQDKKIGTNIKLSQGKIKILQKQLQQFKQKYNKSEIARKQLQLQLQATINRIKIKDQQNKHLTNIHTSSVSHFPTHSQNPNKTIQQLSHKEQQVLAQLTELFKNGVPKDSVPYVLQKFRNVLGDVSQLRETVLECHNFLTDLQEHIQHQLAHKDPDTVLDCNRFIRGYLLANLDIF